MSAPYQALKSWLTIDDEHTHTHMHTVMHHYNSQILCVAATKQRGGELHKVKDSYRKYWNLTAVLRDVHIHTELQHPAPWEVRHTAVGSQVSELHVYDLQAAGARRHVRVTAQQDQAVRVEDRRAVLVPGVVDLVLWGGVDVA